MVLIQDNNLNNPSIMSENGVGDTITNPILIDFIPGKLAIKGTGFDAQSRVIITPAQQSATTVNSTFLSHNIPAPDGTPVWKHVVSKEEYEFREGIYEINIDQDGVFSNSIWIQIELPVELNPTATLSPRAASPQVAGTSILFDFSSNDVSGAEYQLRSRVGGRTWTTLKDFSTDSSYNWTPSEAGTYEIELRVRSNEDPLGNILATDSTEFTITQATIDRTASIRLSATQIELGESVTISAESTGFTSPQYQFRRTFVNTSGDTQTDIIANSGVLTEVTWTPTAIGSNDLSVIVRESLDRGITTESEIVTLAVVAARTANPAIRTVRTDDRTFEI